MVIKRRLIGQLLQFLDDFSAVQNYDLMASPIQSSAISPPFHSEKKSSDKSYSLENQLKINLLGVCCTNKHFENLGKYHIYQAGSYLVSFRKS